MYPVTIIKDRYDGVYSGGAWTAWNLNRAELPLGPFQSDVECAHFWMVLSHSILVGRGSTPESALHDLVQQANKKE